ncbi:MAG: ATP synthase F0 subunit B [Methylotenera sp.]|nr:ATP synthase F0 subunit B [Oligoflexia bacterium]
MAAILQQLGLDQTFFTEFAIFAVLFLVLSNLYFKPFLKLFEARNKRTVQDRAAAEKLVSQAHSKIEEYKTQLSQARADARKDFDAVLLETKKEEAEILSHARNEAKKITQDAVDSISRQTEQLKKQLEVEVESLAKTISDTLLKRQG